MAIAGTGAIAADLPPGLKSAELLPGYITSDGHRMTALHLLLEPGWKTYWRSPGDSGIPPSFDWSQSTNLASAAPRWPRPEVIDSGGARTLGYHDEMVLPIEVTPTRPGEAVQLAARIDFGICRDICVPANLELRAGDTVTDPDPRITAALEDIPRALETQPSCTIDDIADGVRVSLTWPADQVPAPDAAAVEVDGTDVWVSDPEIGEADGHPTATAELVPPEGKPFPLDPSKLRLTLISGDDAVEYRGCAPSAVKAGG